MPLVTDASRPRARASAFASADPRYRTKIRVVTSRAYHALFMWNMLVRPTEEELAAFGEPDWTIFNGGEFPANRFTRDLSSSTSVSLNLTERQMVILGTQYAGEMKKGVFTIMHYIMPKLGVLSLHSSANMGEAGDVSVFFGLSGTGKTTLSADPRRRLIGDDEVRPALRRAGHVARRPDPPPPRAALLDGHGRVQHRGRLLRQVHRP